MTKCFLINIHHVTNCHAHGSIVKCNLYVSGPIAKVSMKMEYTKINVLASAIRQYISKTIEEKIFSFINRRNDI